MMLLLVQAKFFNLNGTKKKYEEYNLTHFISSMI